MDITAAMMVTNEYSGEVIGNAHKASKSYPFVSQQSKLEKLTPCEYFTATVVPANGLDRITIQVQNFGRIAIHLMINSLDGYVINGWNHKIVFPNQFIEYTAKTGEQIVAIPYLLPPPELVAARGFFKNSNSRGNGVLLKWKNIEGAGSYRVFKYVMVHNEQEKRWGVHHSWTIDTKECWILDSDLSVEEFKGRFVDTWYFVAGLVFQGFVGQKSFGIAYKNLVKRNRWYNPDIHPYNVELHGLSVI